ncbi:MAG: hypothetical protein OHK0015_53870 [Chloroflexi bacterium OHK40]
MGYRPDVLVVEDDAAIRELVMETLIDEGYDVVSLSCGRAAMASPLIPKLVLLDRHLGDCDAGAVLAVVGRSWALSSVPVVLMSASSTVHTEAGELGVEGTLAKPFQLDALVACVRGFLDQRLEAREVGA